MKIHFLILSLSLIFPLISLSFKSSLTKEILKDLRIVRILHYVALAGLGMALYLRDSNHLFLYFRSDSLLVFPLFIISLAYAAVFAIVTNNIEDLEADKISNPNRPLVKELSTLNLIIERVYFVKFSLSS